MEDGAKSDKENSFKSDRSDKEGASDIESDFEGEGEEYDDNVLAEFEADLKSLAAEMEAQGVKVPEGQEEENDFDDLSDETVKELRESSMKKFKSDIKAMFEDPMADTTGVEHLKEDDAVD